MALLGEQLAGAGNDLFRRRLEEALVGVLEFASEGFLFIAVGEVEPTTQARDIVRLGVGDRRGDRFAKRLDHRGRYGSRHRT